MKYSVVIHRTGKGFLKEDIIPIHVDSAIVACDVLAWCIITNSCCKCELKYKN